MGIYLNNRRAAFFALLLTIVLLLYSSTLQAPFNFDDEAVIKSRVSGIMNLTVCLEDTFGNLSHETKTVPSSCKIWGSSTSKDLFYSFYPLQYRHLFYSSLIFNYSYGQLNPFSYHLVNIFFIYLLQSLFSLSLQSPFKKASH